MIEISEKCEYFHATEMLYITKACNDQFLILNNVMFPIMSYIVLWFWSLSREESRQVDRNTIHSDLLKWQIYLSLKHKKKLTKKFYYFIFTNRNSTEALRL